MTSPRHEHHAAALHGCTRLEAHPDSVQAVQIERQRVAQELRPFGHCSLTVETSNTSGGRQSTSVRTRQISDRCSATSHEPIQRHESLESYATTRSDVMLSTNSSVQQQHWYSALVKFWTTHVSLTIDEGTHRDHLALERTFLGYLRTSLILVMTGVIIAQLFRIQRAENPNPNIGFYVIGEPLSAAFIGMAIFVLLVGAIRFWRLQDALVRGKALAGGWEVFVIMAMSALLLTATFALILAVNVDKAK